MAALGANIGKLTDEPASRGDCAIVSDKSFISVSSSCCGDSASAATVSVPSPSPIVSTDASSDCVSSSSTDGVSSIASTTSSESVGTLSSGSVSKFSTVSFVSVGSVSFICASFTVSVGFSGTVTVSCVGSVSGFADVNSIEIFGCLLIDASSVPVPSVFCIGVSLDTSASAVFLA